MKTANFAFWFPGNANVSAMQNQPVMRDGNHLLRNVGNQLFLCLQRGFGINSQANTGRNPENMCINRHRWLIEKAISEQIEFFHLNRLSSSMVIKVDFDLTMSILAYNLYRLFACETGKYSSFTAPKIFDKLISNSGTVKINDQTIEVIMKKKRSMPVLLSVLKKFEPLEYPWLHNKQLRFQGASTL